MSIHARPLIAAAIAIAALSTPGSHLQEMPRTLTAAIEQTRPSNVAVTPNSAVGVRYARANSRQEALALLSQVESEKRPGAVIEIPSNRSFAKYGPCTLKPHAVHTRKSGQWGIAGAKPETECTETVSLIRHETTLRYEWYIWWLQAGKTHIETATQTHQFQSLEFEYRCREKEMTTWTGTTLGIIVYRGSKYYARVFHGVRRLACGG